MGLLEAGTLRGQIVLFGQPERVEPVSFRKVMMALPVRTRVAEVYWATVMFPKVPRKAESVWRRIRSTVRAGFRVTVVAVPEEGVKVIEEMVT